MSSLKQFIREIHRRSLWQVLLIYAGGAWAVFAIVQTLTEGLGLPQWFPAFALVLLLVGLPVVLATAFVQEGSPLSGRADSTLLPESSDRPLATSDARGSRRLFTWRNAIAGGVVAMALWGVVATGWLMFAETDSPVAAAADAKSPEALPSIAVLPFENLSPDSNLAFFAKGVHIDLLEVLTKIGGWRVIPRTSVEAYRDTRPDVRQIGQDLGVSSILIASVRRDRDQIKISVQLLDAEGPAQMWAESYERTLDDLFIVQADIARRVANALQAELTTDEQQQLDTPPTTNPLAFDQYLLGMTLAQSQWTDRQPIVEAFERAVQLDPDFALAWATLSGWRRHPEEKREALDRAVALDPYAFEVLIAQAESYEAGLDFDRASELFEQARRVRPGSAEGWAAGSRLLQKQGRWEESVERLERAADLDPMNPVRRRVLLYAYRRLRRFQEAEQYVNRAITLDPASQDYQWQKLQIILATGDTARARRYRDEIAETFNPRGLAIVNVHLSWYYRDYPSLLDAARHARSDASPFSYGWYFPALAYSLMGQADKKLVLADSMRSWGESQLQRLSDLPKNAEGIADAHLEAAAGYALLGEGEEARHHAEQALDLVPISVDALEGPEFAWHVANIYLLLGDAEACIDMLEAVLAVPSTRTAAQLRLDPRYDGIRDNPRFQALLDKYE
jgi:TolB-like protein